jgi:hypothetical protein
VEQMAEKDGLNLGLKISSKENERLEVLMQKLGFKTKAKLIRHLIGKYYEDLRLQEENEKLKIHLAALKALLKDGY